MNIIHWFRKPKPIGGVVSGPHTVGQSLPDRVDFPEKWVLYQARKLPRDKFTHFWAQTCDSFEEAREKGEQERYPYFIHQIPGGSWTRPERFVPYHDAAVRGEEKAP